MALTLYACALLMWFDPQDTAVEISVDLDLLQYMSEGLDAACTVNCCHQQGPTVQPDRISCSSLIGSRCSTHSDHLLQQAAPASTQAQGAQPPCKSCHAARNDDCSSCSSMSNSCDVQSPAGSSSTTHSSSSSSSSSGMVQEDYNQVEQPAAPLPAPCSRPVAYDDDFVWQCYFGDPSSPANQQQQRPKPTSPFAAFASFPGFSL